MPSTGYTLIDKVPTVEEYLYLIDSVKWKKRGPEAVRKALARSEYSVCAVIDSRIIGFGGIIGDGGLHYYITDVVVHPECQGGGIGTAIVGKLMEYFDGIRYPNTLIGVFPTRGLTGFYEKHGFIAQKDHSPAMLQWINEEEQLP